MKKLVEIKNLKVHFPLREGKALVRAVDGVDLEINEGETLGLVGESGCGKSTLGKALLRLIEPTAGDIFYGGQSLLPLKGEDLRGKRKAMQIVFQDPFSSLNPRMRIDDVVGEALDIHGLAKGRRRERIIEILESVGLGEDVMKRFPHEFSGGQRQRIGIARALAVEPEFIVADEPVSALDVSIQAQIINLMKELQDRLGLTYLFIAHDLRVVEYISDRLAVMYLGKIVEAGDAENIYRNPLHPYTKALLTSIPNPDPSAKSSRVPLRGDIPSPVSPPSGCTFHTRCPIAVEKCSNETPFLEEVEKGHKVSCHLV